MKTMQRLWKTSASWLLLISLLLIAGCNDNDVNGPGENPGTPSILQTIKSDANLTKLEELLEGTGLESVLDQSGTTTLFAPTNAAFNKLPVGFLASLSVDQKIALLEYHAYRGSYPVINEIKKEAIVSLQGDPLFMEIGQSFGNLINNRASFVKTNTETGNGILHTIDEVLIPDQMGTLYDNIFKRYDYKNFAARLEAADLADYLKSPGTKTLLTTSDASLDWYINGEGLNFTEDQWKEIMRYHVIAMDITSAGPGTKIALPTMHQNSDSVYLVVDQPGEFLINGISGSPIQQVSATNGKIVLPSGIMLPDKFLGVLTIMDKRYSFKTFRAATVVAGMTGRMYNSNNNADEKFTVFVPADNAMGINNLPSDESELTEVMKYHVLLDQFDADELQHNQSYTTWQGKQLTITKNGAQILVNGVAAVKQPQMTGDNGVVYVIDRVLTVPDN